MKNEGSIRLYVVSHKPVTLPDSNILLPLRSDQRDGICIADKTDYRELRAHYWVWKNTAYNETDKIGFFHYRRYLDVMNTTPAGQQKKVGRRPRPYRIEPKPLARSYQEDLIASRLEQYDIVAPVLEYTGMRVWDRYRFSPGHSIEELEIVNGIIWDKHPAYRAAAEIYLNGKAEYYGNLYIMRGDLFSDYCDWLFGILDVFDEAAPQHTQNADGYLAERLFGIYYTHALQSGAFRCGECPRIHYSCFDDNGHHFKKDIVINAILPPGSYRRSIVRSLLTTRRSR